MVKPTDNELISMSLEELEQYILIVDEKDKRQLTKICLVLDYHHQRLLEKLIRLKKSWFVRFIMWLNK